MTITRINEFVAAENKSEQLADFLKSIVPYIKSSKGCLSCEVLINLENDSVITVIEKWQSIEDHKTSVDNFPKEDMQSVMSLFNGPPKGAYFHS